MASSPVIVKEQPGTFENKKTVTQDSLAQELSEREMIHQRILQAQQDTSTEQISTGIPLKTIDDKSSPTEKPSVDSRVEAKAPPVISEPVIKEQKKPEPSNPRAEVVLEIPNVPQVPEVLEVSQIPDIPQALEASEIPEEPEVMEKPEKPAVSLFDLSADEVDDLFDKPPKYPAMELGDDTFSLEDEARELAGEIGLVATDEIVEDDWVDQFLLANLANERADITDTSEEPPEHADTILAVMPETVLLRVAEYIQEAEPEEAIELESLTVFIEGAANRLEELMIMEEEADNEEITLAETAVIEFYDQLLRQVGIGQAEEREELAKQFINAIYLKIETKTIREEIRTIQTDDEGTHEHKHRSMAPLLKKDLALITKRFSLSTLGNFTVSKATI